MVCAKELHYSPNCLLCIIIGIPEPFHCVKRHIVVSRIKHELFKDGTLWVFFNLHFVWKRHISGINRTHENPRQQHCQCWRLAHNGFQCISILLFLPKPGSRHNLDNTQRTILITIIVEDRGLLNTLGV